MSQENVEVVRSIYAAWERGDFSSVEWADPEIEYVIADGPQPGRWTGLDGMAQAWSNWLAGAWEDFRVEPEEIRELDDERVLVLVHISAKGRSSGLDLDQMQARGVAVFHVRDSKVTRFIAYWDRDRALADLGLEE